MKASLADGYYRGIKYSIYKYHSFQVWGFFILESLGLLGNVLLILYLIIISLFNKRIIKLLSILSLFSIIFLALPFIYGILYIFIPYLILCPIPSVLE
ncbi:hypothetical protein KHQ81_02910 [Mycoplasmatota bacterium]|nr:hypothetical protein KHQ81_02910 [Mycoplasmatota bacterium]